MKILIALVAIFALVVPAALGGGGAAVPSPGVARPADELKPLPPLTLTDLEGKAVPSGELKDHILVLDFWATWCAPCLAEVPFLNALQDKYSGRGVKVVGVTLTSGEAKEVKPFITRYKMKYKILMGDDGQTYDLNIMGFPTTFLVTKDNKIYKKYLGAGPMKARQLETDIEALLTGEKQ